MKRTPARRTAGCADDQPFDLVFVGLRLGDESAFDLLETLRQAQPRLAGAAMTANPNIASAVGVGAIGRGSFGDAPGTVAPDQVPAVIERLIRHGGPGDQVTDLEGRMEAEDPESEMESPDPQVRRTMAQARIAAPCRRVPPDPRRERNRQAYARSRHSHLEQTVRRAVRHRELSESEPRASGKRTVRPCPGGFPRCPRRQCRQDRCRRRAGRCSSARSATLPRGTPAQAAAVDPGSAVSESWRSSDPLGRRSSCGSDQPRSGSVCCLGSVPPGASLPAERDRADTPTAPASLRPLRLGRPLSGVLRPPDWKSFHGLFTARHARPWLNIPGLGIFASFAMRSNASRSWGRGLK